MVWNVPFCLFKTANFNFTSPSAEPHATNEVANATNEVANAFHELDDLEEDLVNNIINDMVHDMDPSEDNNKAMRDGFEDFADNGGTGLHDLEPTNRDV